LALYTNHETQNAQRHRQTDGQQDYANNRSYCVAVRSAKNAKQTRVDLTYFRECERHRKRSCSE